MARTFDLIVLGGGSAAFAAAIRAAEAGKSAALVEGGMIGGTCVNVGCVPSKTLIAAALTRHRAVHPAFDGLGLSAGPADWATVFGQKTELVDELRQSKYLDVLEAYPLITWVKGRGVVTGTEPVRLSVNGETLEAPAMVVATGAQPWAPPIPGLGDTPFWTSTEALEAPDRPKDLVVLGGSAVGLEIGQAYQRLGVSVTVLEAMDRLVPQEDTDVSEALLGYLREEGLSVHPSVTIERVRHDGARFTVEGRQDGAKASWTADRLLVATGRRPTTGGFGLEEAGVKLDGRGAVVVDEHLRSSVPSIYAAGDVTGHAMFVYVAAAEGAAAAANALGLGPAATVGLDVVPKVTFTDPQVASVGLTEDAAEAAGIDCSCSSLPLEYVPRALANRDTRGFVKLVVERKTERIIGMHAIAPEAGEIIQVGTMAVQARLTLGDLTGMFFPYLTMVEAVKLAAITFHKDVAKLSCCAGG